MTPRKPAAKAAKARPKAKAASTRKAAAKAKPAAKPKAKKTAGQQSGKRRAGIGKRSAKAGRGKAASTPAEPAKRSRRPTVAEVPPLLSTYEQPKPPGAWFDEKAAKHAVDWIERLRHFKGRWAGHRFLLMKWQARLIREMFGWKNEDGTRLYRLVYVEAPRKTGKTSLAAAVALYLAHGDGEAAPEIYFAAYDKDQAKIAYDAARYMTEQDDELQGKTAIYLSRYSMELLENPGGFMRILSRESAKQYGLNMQGLIFDELMTQKNREFWDAVTTSQGSRESPLIFAISTAGWEIESICFEQHAHTESISTGEASDPTFLGVVYGADMEADWTEEDVWIAANPSLGETTSIDYYRQKVNKAKIQPTEQNAFRTLLLSQWVGQAERFIDMEVWDKNAALPGSPAKRAAFGGLDLSTTTDMSAFVVIAENSRGELDVYPHIFLPKDKLQERERRQRAPYSAWARAGLLTLTPGAVVDYDYIRSAVNLAGEEFDLREINYDRWNSSQLVAELEEDGFEMVKIGQGFAGLSSPTKELLRLAGEEKLRHGGNPLLRWCANSVAAAMDPAGNVKPDKSRSAQKIDPIVALIMAIDGWARRGQELKQTSPYAKHDLAVA